MNEPDDRVVLETAAVASALRHIRLVASAIASDLGMDVEELDDLRVAVNELFGPLVEAAPDGARLAVEYRGSGDRLEIEGSVPSSVDEAPTPDQLAAEILGVVVDTFRVTTDDGRATASLVKRLSGRA